MPALTAVQMRANHVVDGAWCPGCGLFWQVNGEHRPDCPAEPSPLVCSDPDCDAIRLPSEPAIWAVRGSSTSYFCPTHQKKGTTR